jgi:hypothetical protein
MSARQQQQTAPDELERYRQMPFKSTADWEKGIAQTLFYGGLRQGASCFLDSQ